MSSLYLRPFLKILRDRLVEPQPLIQVLTGPRQVGKTTAVTLQLDLPKTFYASADESVGLSGSWIQEQWQRALSQNGPFSILILDEIQKVEGWSQQIKTLWDRSLLQKQPLKVVLSGSSSLELSSGASDSLAGRFERISVPHWGFHEMQEAFGISLEDYLIFGGYPGFQRFKQDPDRWWEYFDQSLISAVIEKDILRFRAVKSPALFRQSFDILCHYPAQAISYQKLLGQIQDQGNVDLIKRYLTLFQAAFLLMPIQKWSGSSHRKIASSPKIIPLAPALSGRFRSEIEPGRLFEAAVGAVFATISQLNLYYWAQENYEVDYIVQIGKEVYAIEVKSGRKKLAKSLEVFKKLFPKSKSVFITPDLFPAFCKDPKNWILKYSL